MSTLLRRRRILGGLIAFGMIGPGCTTLPKAGDTISDTDINTVLADPVRTDDDRKSDAGRKPAELLRFAQIKPGMRILDVSAGGGYTTQLMALATGPTGRVYAQVEAVRPGLEKRLAQHPQPNIELLVRPFSDLFPADAAPVDIITFVLSYHDIAYSATDRAKMNRALFAALKPGGRLVLIDHAAKSGTGVQDSKTLHRIDEQLVRSEVTAAGFRLEAESSFLRNPSDPREQAFFDMSIPADRFVLRFIRPT